METTRIFMDAKDARERYQAYLKNKHFEKPEDEEIRKAYRLLSKGQLIVQAIASIKAAGVDEKGYPKLAMARADAKHCHLSINRRGGGTMADASWVRSRAAWRHQVEFPGGSFPTRAWDFDANRFSLNGKAIMPIIPADIRPKRALENYHVLWEAEWTPTPPVDPYLLQRIGRSDMWIVLGMWDLTEVERAVLAGRIPVN